MKQFNICPSCKHFNTCVLTTHKEEVWSCSEYDNADVSEVKNKTNQLLATA